MAQIPRTFTTETGAIASYDFNDFAAGTGIQTFYGFSRSANTNSFALSTATPFSQRVITSGAISVSAPLILDFDSEEFLLPRIVKGTATINVPYRVTNSSGSNSNFVWVQLNKIAVDGTQYMIGQNSGAFSGSEAGGAKVECIQIRDIDINSGAIRTGEKIRLTIMVQAETAGNSPNAKIAHDPQNRTGDVTYETTKLVAWIPFLLDA